MAAITICSMLSCVQLFATPWTVARQAPLSIGFSSKNTEMVCHFLLQRIFLTQGWKLYLLHFLHWHAVSLPLASPGKTSRWIVSFILFWPHCTACGILVLRPGIEPGPLHWERRILTTEPPRKCQWSALDEDYRWELKAHFFLITM